MIQVKYFRRCSDQIYRSQPATVHEIESVMVPRVKIREDYLIR